MIRVTGIALALTLVLGASAAAAGTAAAPPSPLTTLASLGSCPQLASLETSLLGALSGTSGKVDQEIAAIRRAATKTPAAVRRDFVTIADALGDALATGKGVDLSAGSSAAVTKLMRRLQTPPVTKAAAHIAAWATKNCHD